MLYCVTGFGKSKSAVLMADIDLFHPTQAIVGIKEVERKQKKIRESSKEERAKYFKDNTIPVVLGPDGRLYLIDHHHFLLAAQRENYKKVPYKIVGDLSKSRTMEEFWEKMKLGENGKKWVYLRANGQDIEVKDLPSRIEDVVDDPFRSLAGQLRRTGFYDKSNIPFAEMFWADFLRYRIPDSLLENDWNRALRLAEKLTMSHVTSFLPGHIERLMCKKFYE